MKSELLVLIALRDTRFVRKYVVPKYVCAGRQLPMRLLHTQFRLPLGGSAPQLTLDDLRRECPWRSCLVAAVRDEEVPCRLF